MCFGPSLNNPSHKKMRLAELAAVFKSECLNPPNDGVTVDSVHCLLNCDETKKLTLIIISARRRHANRKIATISNSSTVMT